MATQISTVARKVAKATTAVVTNSTPPVVATVNNCICGGTGVYRLDVPFGHPEFGKLQICECQGERVAKAKYSRAFRMCQLSGLSGMTFASFKQRGLEGTSKAEADSIQQAYRAAESYAKRHDGWLFMVGAYGCGKTHLAAAIANYISDNHLAEVLFITVPDMLDSLRYTFDEGSHAFGDTFNEIRNIPVLVLDDFGTENVTNWAHEKLFQLINYRYVNRLPMVVTSNSSRKALENKLPRLASRILDTNLTTRVAILAGDFRDKSR